MFNVDRRVRLAEFAHLGRVVRDTDFFSVGKISTQVDARLVPVQSIEYLASALNMSGIAGIICPPELANEVSDGIGCITTNDPQRVAYAIHCDLAARSGYLWDGFASRIAVSAQIHASAEIAARDVVIGEDVVVEAGAIIGERTIIAENCTIGPRSLIGTSAFELYNSAGRNHLRRQAGGVWIGSDTLFLGAVVVSRSVFPTFTRIGNGCAFDTMVQIAHDCDVGNDVSIACGAMLMGRVMVGPGVYIGPNATVSNGITIGDRASISLGATVVKDVSVGQKVTGNFAVDHATFIHNLKQSLRKD